MEPRAVRILDKCSATERTGPGPSVLWLTVPAQQRLSFPFIVRGPAFVILVEEGDQGSEMISLGSENHSW